MKAGLRTGSFRPEVRDIIRATKLETDEMINFILTRPVAAYTVLCVYLVLFALRYITYGL